MRGVRTHAGCARLASPRHVNSREDRRASCVRVRAACILGSRARLRAYGVSRGVSVKNLGHAVRDWSGACAFSVCFRRVHPASDLRENVLVRVAGVTEAASASRVRRPAGLPPSGRPML